MQHRGRMKRAKNRKSSDTKGKKVREKKSVEWGKEKQ